MCNLIQTAVSKLPKDQKGVLAYFYVNPFGNLMMREGGFFTCKGGEQKGITFEELLEEIDFLREDDAYSKLSFDVRKHPVYWSDMAVVSRG